MQEGDKNIAGMEFSEGLYGEPLSAIVRYSADINPQFSEGDLQIRIQTRTINSFRRNFPENSLLVYVRGQLLKWEYEGCQTSPLTLFPSGLAFVTCSEIYFYSKSSMNLYTKYPVVYGNKENSPFQPFFVRRVFGPSVERSFEGKREQVIITFDNSWDWLRVGPIEAAREIVSGLSNQHVDLSWGLQDVDNIFFQHQAKLFGEQILEAAEMIESKK